MNLSSGASSSGITGEMRTVQAALQRECSGHRKKILQIKIYVFTNFLSDSWGFGVLGFWGFLLEF